MGALKVTRPTATVHLCLDMSARAEWERLDDAITKARRTEKDRDRLTGNPEIRRMVDEIRSLEADMEAETAEFTLQALPKNVWKAMLAGHPARDGNDLDAQAGVNIETFWDAVLTYVDSDRGVATIVGVTKAGEPVDFDPAADWVELADEMTDQQYTSFANVAQLLNQGRVSVPFSRVASSLTETSDET
jgi:hypothetical protein